MCYLDLSCLSPGTDEHGGLGCNAGGYESCRFCGFGEFIACPGAVRSVLLFDVIVDTPIEEFDEDSYAQNLMGLPFDPQPMAVDLFVTGASIRVTATLVFDDDGGALSAGSMLGSMELDALSSALGVSLDLVVDIETVSMAFEEAPKPPSWLGSRYRR
jgi:hypothetical protein